MKSITRRCAAWIACLALLFSALMPSLSHAVPATAGAPMAEICTLKGTKLVKIGAEPSSSKSQLQHPEHCPFCSTHAGTAAIPPSAAVSFVLRDTGQAHPALFYHAPRALFIWTSAQSRAPPAQA